MGFGIKELLIILVIVILLFGTKKLKNIGADLGSAIKGFRHSVTDGDDEKKNIADDNAEVTIVSDTENTTTRNNKQENQNG